jgi:hypothetical protein
VDANEEALLMTWASVDRKTRGNVILANHLRHNHLHGEMDDAGAVDVC